MGGGIFLPKIRILFEKCGRRDKSECGLAVNVSQARTSGVDSPKRQNEEAISGVSAGGNVRGRGAGKIEIW